MIIEHIVIAVILLFMLIPAPYMLIMLFRRYPQSQIMLSGIIGAYGAIFLLAALFPLYAGYYQELLRAGNVMSLVNICKTRIMEDLIKHNLQSKLMGNDTTPFMLLGTVNTGETKDLYLIADGKIIASGSDEGQVILSIPVLQDGETKWRCLAGGPIKLIPRACRDPEHELETVVPLPAETIVPR